MAEKDRYCRNISFGQPVGLIYPFDAILSLFSIFVTDSYIWGFFSQQLFKNKKCLELLESKCKLKGSGSGSKTVVNSIYMKM